MTVSQHADLDRCSKPPLWKVESCATSLSLCRSMLPVLHTVPHEGTLLQQPHSYTPAYATHAWIQHQLPGPQKAVQGNLPSDLRTSQLEPCTLAASAVCCNLPCHCQPMCISVPALADHTTQPNFYICCIRHAARQPQATIKRNAVSSRHTNTSQTLVHFDWARRCHVYWAALAPHPYSLLPFLTPHHGPCHQNACQQGCGPNLCSCSSSTCSAAM